MTARATTTTEPLPLVAYLIEAGNVDTVYRDVYIRRAQSVLADVLPLEEFRRIEEEQAELARMPVMLARALERADWQRVKELSTHGDALARALDGKRREIELARAVYGVADIRLDPFSPGLLGFTRIPGKELPSIRTRAVEHLTRLERTDTPWSAFYARRRAALQALALASAVSSEVTAAAVDPREAAQRALKAGDMRALAKLADTLLEAVPTTKPGSPFQARATAAPAARSMDVLTPYSDQTLEGARQLGLAPRRLAPQPALTSLRSYVWSPLFDEESGRIDVKKVELPAGTPEEFRERLEMLMIHPLVNSGGARHVPALVAEDVLVEDFADPKEGDEVPVSPLLEALGLARRRALSRASIEQALLARGADVLENELSLDPCVFRLVCIPPDVHLRLGGSEGWGRQPFWTHFDGYLVMPHGRLRALAGGDVRFGGLYNLLGVNREYDSDRLMVRFAVVRRARMEAW